MFLNKHTKHIYFIAIAVFELAEGNTQHLIIALVQTNGKYGYLTAPRKCSNCLLCSWHVKVIINGWGGFFSFSPPPPPIGLTEHSVSGVHSNPGVLSKEKRLLRYLSYAAGQEMGYVICGRTKLALVCWLLSLSF